MVKASADTTGGAFTVFEERDPVDTPLHVHEHEDELFYVLEGEHVFQVGDEELRVGPGGLVFAPRGVPHAQRRVVPRTGRVLVMTSPAGFEGFFRELATGERPGVGRTPTRAPRGATASPGCTERGQASAGGSRRRARRRGPSP